MKKIIIMTIVVLLIFLSAGIVYRCLNKPAISKPAIIPIIDMETINDKIEEMENMPNSDIPDAYLSNSSGEQLDELKDRARERYRLFTID